MQLLARRSLLAVAAVVDIALHARPAPVSAKALAARHELPPRQLEAVLQALVRAGIMRGLRGPKGGYELARERRRISAGEIVRVAMSLTGEDGLPPPPRSALVEAVVEPAVRRAGEAFLAALDGITVEELCRQAEAQGSPAAGRPTDFTI
jgi:Rrf2 family transcriptional regulator, iron-sulfur cluster assembly transcription factor